MGKNIMRNFIMTLEEYYLIQEQEKKDIEKQKKMEQKLKKEQQFQKSKL